MLSSGRLARDRKIGRRGDQIAPRRVGAGSRRPRRDCVRSRPSVFRYASSIGGTIEAVVAAAARARSFRQARNRRSAPRSHAARDPNACATVLAITLRCRCRYPGPRCWRRGGRPRSRVRPSIRAARDRASILRRRRRRGGSGRFATPASLRLRQTSRLARPIIKPLAVGIGIPALAQRDRIDVQPQRGLVDRLFQRKRHRRSAGAAERRAGRQVADDVEIGELLRFRRIDQPRQCGDGRVHRRPGVGMGGQRQRFEIALRATAAARS